MSYSVDTVSSLLPEERQKNYIYLLDDLKTSYEVMKYLVNFSRTQNPLSEEEDASAAILDECSLHVRYLFTMNQEGRVGIRINCDSQVVQGVLAIFADIYQGANGTEIRRAVPTYQKFLPQGIAPSFERRDGVKRLYYKLLYYSTQW